MLATVLLGLLAALVLLAIVVATRPAQFRVERDTTVAAPAGAVLDLVEDFHQWKRWSPWDRLDATQVVTIAGAPRGIGATYHWVGKKNGEGRMEIVEHQPGHLVGIQLDFLKPFPSHNRCDFTVEPAPGGGTRVVWSMIGHNTFMGKAFGMVVDMDRMLGKDFASGLASLKSEAEGATGVASEVRGAAAGAGANL